MRQCISGWTARRNWFQCPTTIRKSVLTGNININKYNDKRQL